MPTISFRTYGWTKVSDGTCSSSPREIPTWPASGSFPPQPPPQTAGPQNSPSLGSVVVSIYNGQQHFTYLDSNDNIQDVWYGGGWNLQQLTQ
jgi:hypothetical protein